MALLIKGELARLGLSQAKAARLSEVNPSSFNRIVNGKEPPYPMRGRRIAKALGWRGNWQALFEEEFAVNDPKEAIR